MFYTAEAAEKPRKVTIEKLPDGRRRIILTDNTAKKEDKKAGTSYTYDVADFYLPDDRTETVKSITESFTDWWEYGKTSQEETTLEERVSVLEELALGQNE